MLTFCFQYPKYGLADHEAETSPVGDEHGSSVPESSQRARPSSERNEYAGRALRARKNSFPRAASRPAHSQKPSPHTASIQPLDFRSFGRIIVQPFGRGNQVSKR